MKTDLQPGERLALLQAQDRFRRWNSLEDVRTCILCEQTFRGREVVVRRQRSGHCELYCPTEGCRSKPHQWIYPVNTRVARPVYQDWWRAVVEPHVAAPVRAARAF